MLSNLISPRILDLAIFAQSALVAHLGEAAKPAALYDLEDLLLAYEKATGSAHAVDAIYADLDDPDQGKTLWNAYADKRLSCA